jgi:hypothetical protein
VAAQTQTTTTPGTTPGLETSMATTLEVLGWEIELAGARCIFLDKLIGELMQTTPPEHRQRLLEGMQAVDLLAQHLTGLSAFARQMSADAPTEENAPVTAALAEITLGALAERMFTAFGGEEEVADDEADAGDLDLF